MKLDNPMIRQRLLELAKTQDVMVASCKGEYQPLEALLAQEPSPVRAKHTLPGIAGGGE